MTPWTAAHQVPLFMGLPTGLDLLVISFRGSSDPRIKPAFPALAGGFFPTESPGAMIQVFIYLFLCYVVIANWF